MAVVRWDDGGLDALAKQGDRVEAKVDKLDEKVDELIATRQMSWQQVFTIAASFLAPMVALVGIVLAKGS